MQEHKPWGQVTGFRGQVSGGQVSGAGGGTRQSEERSSGKLGGRGTFVFPFGKRELEQGIDGLNDLLGTARAGYMGKVARDGSEIGLRAERQQAQNQ